MRPPKCRTCGKEHALGGCPEFRSTAARKDVHGSGDVIQSSERSVGGSGTTLKASPTTDKGIAGNQALPVDANLIVGVDPGSKDFGAKVIGRVMEDGRIEILSLTHSKAQFNKAEYQRQYMADLRTIKRLGLNCTVAEFRKAKEK